MEINKDITRLYHHGVLGMKWGQHKSGLERARDSYKRKASVEFSKSMLAATKANNKRAKLINPSYYINRNKQKTHRKKYDEYSSLAKAAQRQIDTNDPIGTFMSKSEKAIDKGMNWCAKKCK